MANRLILLLFVLLAGCSTSPLMPKTVNVMLEAGADPIPPVAPSVQYYWTWDYEIPMPADNIEFDLESSPDFVNWTLVARTNQPPVPFNFTSDYLFFRVGAHWIIPPP